ncbi:hypothetical protein D3C77_549650 [compost metagenome]
MAHRLVQQHTGPAGTQHHRQGAGRRRNGLKVDQGLAQRLAGKAHDAFIGEIAIVGSPTTAMTAALTSTVLLDDHTDVEPHQRTYIRGQAAICSSDQNALPDPGHAHCNLLDTRVQGTRCGVYTLEQLDLLGPAEHFKRVVGAVELDDVLAFERLDTAVLPGTGNRAGGTRS